VNVTRNEVSDYVMMAEQGIESLLTEGFVSRFKITFYRFRVGVGRGGEEIVGCRNSQNT
jgi:hypothetical protein